MRRLWYLAGVGVMIVALLVVASTASTVQQSQQPIPELEGARSILARNVPAGSALYANTYPLWSFIYPSGWTLYNFTSGSEGTVIVNRTGTAANIEIFYTDNGTLASNMRVYVQSIPQGTPVLQNTTYTSTNGLNVTELLIGNSYTESGVQVVTHTHAYFSVAFGYVYIIQYVETVTPLDQQSNGLVQGMFSSVYFGG